MGSLLSRRPALVTQADVRRVIRAAKAEGVFEDGGGIAVEPNGTIRILPIVPAVDKHKSPVEPEIKIVL
jgi:hypothetical protein